MIPYRDESRIGSGFPFMTAALIAMNFLVFFWELAASSHGQHAIDTLIRSLGVTPYAITHDVQLPPPAPHPEYLTILTALFVHEGWLHIGGNMLYLYIFGPSIEWLTGPFRFLIFYLLCGGIAGSVQVIAHPQSTIVAIGASGAIAGVLGAFILFFATDTIDAVLPLGCYPLLLQVPALVFIGIWIVIQIYSARAQTGDVGGIGYLEHVAGFVSGMILIWLFKTKSPPPRRAST